MTIAIEVNCTTGEVTERPLTQEELADQAKNAAEYAARRAEEEAAQAATEAAKVSARAKLASLGLTPEEVTALTN